MEEEEELNKDETAEQQIWSWGAGTDGQLGTTRFEDKHLPQLLRLPFLSSSAPISMLACGGAHVIVLTSEGKVLTWGRGSSGQLGHGDSASSLHPKPVDSLQSFVITHVSAGWSHSGFVSATGLVFTCGDGSFGQLGHGDYKSHWSPMEVSFFVKRHVKQIACGMRHSLVLLKGNQVYAFGSGKRGQLGISNEKVNTIISPQITCGLGDSELVSISANGDHSAALCVYGHLYTWGRGFSDVSDSYYPQLLESSLWIARVSLGWNHALLLTGDKEVYMLGGYRHGVHSGIKESNTGKRATGESAMKKVISLKGEKVVQVAAGAEHSALVTENGVIKTWGWGEHGQLGLGDTRDGSSPQTVSLGNEDVDGDIMIDLCCGSGFTFAVRTPLLNRRC